MTDDYRKECLKWASKHLYRGKSESAVYADVKKRNMHYAYTGFLEMFPNTAYRPEIEKLMQEFRLYKPDKTVVLSYEEMKEKLNYDGVDAVYRWNNAFSGFFGKRGSFMILADNVDGPHSRVTFQNKLGLDYVGPVLCLGNLQVLRGTFTPLQGGKLQIEAEIIFPARHPAEIKPH